MPNRYKVAGKYLPPARICSGCGAIIARGDESYPDNHWDGCPGGEPVPITPEAFAAASCDKRHP